MAADCGSTTCPVNGGFYVYDPSIAGNAVLLGVSALIVPGVLFMGAKSRTPFFSAALTTGLLLEILGFIGRILMSGDRDSQTYFTLSLIGSFLGPSFMIVALFMVLPHILTVYGSQNSPIRPVLAAFALHFFMFISVIIQLIGIIFLVYGFNDTSSATGGYVVAGGLAVQTACIIFFSVLYLLFLSDITSSDTALDHVHAETYESLRFRWLQRAVETSALLLAVCSIYGIVEMVTGISGKIFQTEAAFMVLSAALPIIAAMLLTVFHPGMAFGSAWAATSPRRLRPPRTRPVIQHHPQGYNMHLRDDAWHPISHTSVDMPKRSQRSSQVSGTSTWSPGRSPGMGWEPGLPANPKTGPRPPPKAGRELGHQRRPSDRGLAAARPAPKHLVDSEALW